MALFTSYLTEQVHFIPVAVLGASLMGSGHCAAMCGGLVLTLAGNKKSNILYHIGRLTGYCGLGAIAGLVGESTLKVSVLNWVATGLISFGFVLLGFRLWQNKPLHLFRVPTKIFRKVPPFGFGFLSAFLPCGWLHVFVLGAVATRSAIMGGIYLAIFWLGTLPALVAGPMAIHRVFRPLISRAPKVSAIILIAIGLGSLSLKLIPFPQGSSQHCHFEKE